MAHTLRPIVLLMLLLLVAMLTLVAAPSPAYADHCEVTELVVRVVDEDYEEPGSEDDKPNCALMEQLFYPTLGCPSDAKFMDCVNSQLAPVGVGPADVADAVCIAIGGTPGTSGGLPACYEGPVQ